MTSCPRKALQETPWKKCDNCTNTTDLPTLINACSALSSPPSNLRANSYVRGRRPAPLQRSEAHSPAALRELALMAESCLLAAAAARSSRLVSHSAAAAPVAARTMMTTRFSVVLYLIWSVLMKLSHTQAVFGTATQPRCVSLGQQDEGGCAEVELEPFHCCRRYLPDIEQDVSIQ